MKKILTGLLFAATLLFSFTASASCCGKPRWGYFYTSANSTVPAGFGIDWSTGGNSTSDGIFLSSSDSTEIVIENSGVYLVTYSIHAFSNNNVPDVVAIEFALFLNEKATPVPGSVYSVFNFPAIFVPGTDTQLFGQAIVHVRERNSVLQLVNIGGFDAFLYNELGDNAVTASIMINRIDPHD